MRRLTGLLGALAALGGMALLATVMTSGSAQAQSAEEGDAVRGEELYRLNCLTCHGPDGEGVDPWPAIADSGAAAADFQLRTGRMPFTQEPGTQAQRKPPAYDEQEIRDLVAFVATLGDGPGIPEYRIDESLLPRGQDLFAANCAPCHGATANGGAVGGGAIAWPLTSSPPRIVAEAMITGPGQMPVFDLPQEDLDAVITYVEYLRQAPTPGGFEIGGIGPVPEGFVAWFVGMGLLGLIAYLIGREWQRGEEPG